MRQQVEGLKTYEVRTRLPRNFLSVPGVVQIESVKLPKAENIEAYKPLIYLVQNIFRHTNFFDSKGSYIVPTSFSENGTVEQIPISPDSPQHLHDDAVGSILFNHDVPVLGLVSDYLRFAKQDGQTTNFQQIDGQQISWSIVISSLMDQFTFYDADGNPINKQDIKAINNTLFGNKKYLREELDQNIQDQSFQDILSLFIQQYFDIDIATGSAIVKDPSILNVSLGSVQRAVTPFSFGNCKEGCRFCYVDRRLSTIVYPNNWFRSVDDINQILTNYDPETKTGPAQARMAMMDWEPTEHPQFLKIMEAVAQRDPENQIPVITHGGSLTEELLQQVANDPLLKKLLLFQVSLNSADPTHRATIMAGKGNNPLHHENAIASLKKMHELGIAFDVSLVATTNWVPMEDILETIDFADQFKPNSYIRVALPTATKDHDPNMLLSPEELQDIDRQVVAHREKVSTPIIVTVGLLNRTGLQNEIEGVIPDSPAFYAGIKHGSKILLINGIEPRSRTESTLMLLDNWMKNKKGNREQCVVVFQLPDGSQKEVDLTQLPQKSPRFLGEKPVGIYGLLIHDDVDFGIFEKMRQLQLAHSFKHPLMVTSEIMIPFFEQAISKTSDKEKVDNLIIVPGKNDFFGGNVGIAGLLTFSDILKSLKKANLTHKPDAIFVSASMITRGGYDLQGYHYHDLSSLLGIPVIPLKARTGSL